MPEKPGPYTASLDRIDSTKGYTEYNIQWVHKLINIAKSTLTNNQFISMCMDICENNKNIQNISWDNVSIHYNKTIKE